MKLRNLCSSAVRTVAEQLGKLDEHADLLGTVGEGDNRWDRGYAVAVVAQERETAQKLWILSEEHRSGRHHNEDGTPNRSANCPMCAAKVIGHAFDGVALTAENALSIGRAMGRRSTRNDARCGGGR